MTKCMSLAHLTRKTKADIEPRYLLRAMPGKLPSRRDRRISECRVCYGDEGGIALQQGEAVGQRRQVGARAGRYGEG